MLRVPKLRGDEDVLALEAWNVLKGTLEALCDFLLVLVAVIGGKTVSQLLRMKEVQGP